MSPKDLAVAREVVKLNALVAGQVGLTRVSWNTAQNFRNNNEYAAKDRFRGRSIGLNFAIKFYFALRTGQSSTILDAKLTGNNTIKIALMRKPYF